MRNDGKIIRNDGKIDANIAARKGRGFAIAGDIIAILNEVPFGKHRIKAGLCMRDSMLLSAILNNSEVWYGVKEYDIEKIEKVDEYLLRGILNCHSKTSRASMYLETGCIPLKFIVMKRRIMYLYHCLLYTSPSPRDLSTSRMPSSA